MSKSLATEILLEMKSAQGEAPLSRLFSRLHAETEKKLVEQARKLLLRLSRRHGYFRLGHISAEDLVQDTFLQVWKSYPHFRGDSKAESWLYSILYSKYLDLKDKPGNSVPGSQLAPLDDSFTYLLGDGITKDFEPIVLPSIDDEIDSARLRGACRQAIRRLPERARNVLHVTQLGELPPSQVAPSLGLTPNATKIRLHRAHNMLRRSLQNSMPAVLAELRQAA